MMAVTTPTGISTGASSVRATRSQSTRNAAPKSADAGSSDAVIDAHQQPDQVRHDDADETDRPGHAPRPRWWPATR